VWQPGRLSFFEERDMARSLAATLIRHGSWLKLKNCGMNGNSPISAAVSFLKVGVAMSLSDETAFWVFIALISFCALLVVLLVWISQRTYKEMLSKIDLNHQAPILNHQAPMWTYTKKETTYYDNPTSKKEPPSC
jgi:hypothetical protein